jgi:hypothetical protein
MFLYLPFTPRLATRDGKKPTRGSPVDTFRVKEYRTLAPHDVNREAQGDGERA